MVSAVQKNIPAMQPLSKSLWVFLAADAGLVGVVECETRRRTLLMRKFKLSGVCCELPTAAVVRSPTISVAKRCLIDVVRNWYETAAA